MNERETERAHSTASPRLGRLREEVAALANGDELPAFRPGAATLAALESASRRRPRTDPQDPPEAPWWESTVGSILNFLASRASRLAERDRSRVRP